MSAVAFALGLAGVGWVGWRVAGRLVAAGTRGARLEPVSRS